MIPEDRVLFACARQIMLSEHKQTVLDFNRNYNLSWDVIFSKAEQHGVAPLIYINLCQHNNLKLNIPAAISEHYHKVTLRNSIAKERRAQKLAEVLAYFRERSIDVLLIKGGALDLLVYENPAYVTSNDIDIVLRRRLEDFDPVALRHMMDTLHGSGIEFDYYGHHDMTINGALPVDFSRIWGDARAIDYRGQPVYLMCPEDMFISLCINSCRKRFFRLKSLMDIAETLRVEKALQWERMAEKAKAYDCQNIIYTALHVTKLTLGCNIPEMGMQRLGVGKLRAAMIETAVSQLIRFTTLPANPNAVSINQQRPVDISLILPYLAYRGYQIRHKLFHEVPSRE